MYMLDMPDIKCSGKRLLDVVLSAAGNEDLGITTAEFREQLRKYRRCQTQAGSIGLI
jgi:hypothetical protein